MVLLKREKRGPHSSRVGPWERLCEGRREELYGKRRDILVGVLWILRLRIREAFG